ncbi:DMT family transporter [Pseudomonadota bacterium]
MSVPAAYVGIILIWATTPLAIQWSSESVGFVFGVTARMVLGAVACLLVMVLLRVRFDWHKKAMLAYVASGIGIYAAMICVYWASQYISSGLVSVVYGMLPMVTTLVAALWLGGIQWQPNKFIGILFGIVGLAVIFDPDDSLSMVTAMGISGVLASVILHSISMIWIKRIGADISPLSQTAGGLWFALPAYLLTWFLLGNEFPSDIPLKAGISILYLAIVGSVIGFMLFYYTLKHVSADAIALITLVTPVLALCIGSAFNDEILTWHIAAGALFILSGLGLHHWGDKWLAFVRKAV